jgi:hypothetical protein
MDLLHPHPETTTNNTTMKTKRKTQQQPTLCDVAHWCNEVRGRKASLLREMGRRGVPGNWANLSRWLLPPNNPRHQRPWSDTEESLIALWKEVRRRL